MRGMLSLLLLLSLPLLFSLLLLLLLFPLPLLLSLLLLLSQITPRIGSQHWSIESKAWMHHVYELPTA